MRRHLHLIHRWSGIVLAGFLLAWFVSGVVMLFVPFPKLTEDVRLSTLPPLRNVEPLVSPAVALAACVTDRQGIEMLRLAPGAGHPSFLVLVAGRWCGVDARTGRVLEFDAASILERARRHMVFDPAEASVDAIEHDLWTVPGAYDPHRPLFRVQTGRPDGLELYLSSRTGEIVLETQGWERAWNWIGAVVHWIYITPLRALGEPWRQLILWLAGVAILMVLSGFVLGVDRLRLLGRRYAGGMVTPYRGWKRWHHLFGLCCTLFVLLWLSSGWLSMHPFGWARAGKPGSAELHAFAGGALAPVGDPGIIDAIVRSYPSARELEWGRVGGQDFIRVRSPEQNLRVDATGKLLMPLSAEEVARFAERLSSVPVASITELAREDSYFHGPQRIRHLPVFRLELADDERTSYYIDPREGRLVMRLDDSARIYRWLFAAAHRLDFPPLGTLPWLRKTSVVVLSVLCGILCLSACVIACRRVLHSLRKSPSR